MTKDSKPAKTDELVASTDAAPVELSETELSQVSGGDNNKTTTTTSTTKGDKQGFLVYKLTDVLITS